MRAVIMAGGFGTRLRPLTDHIPKPLLPVGGKPLLERTVEQLRDAGLNRIWISLGYRAEMIVDYFGDGSDFDVEINYIREDKPLGTAGALGLLEAGDKPILVTNGDVLTQLDYAAMLAHHLHEKADMTVAAHKYTVQVPYGVLESNGYQVCEIREKPTLECCINAGMYILSPRVHRSIEKDQPLLMSSLIEQLIEDGRPVIQYPFVDYWLDIGQPADYERAQHDVATLQKPNGHLMKATQLSIAAAMLLEMAPVSALMSMV